MTPPPEPSDVVSAGGRARPRWAALVIVLVLAAAGFAVDRATDRTATRAGSAPAGHGRRVPAPATGSVVVLGRLGSRWLVSVTSTSRQSRTARSRSYGVLDSTGRFTPWTSISSTTPDGLPWRSPDGSRVLVADHGRLEVRQAASGRVVAVLGQ
jgi:hypothetical protein